MPMRVASTDGVEVVVHHLHAAATADGGNPPARLLIAHATGFNAPAYGPLADALAGLQPAVDISAVDVRGHGATVATDGWAVDWHGYTDDVVAAAQACTTAGVPLYGFGHSMGGAALLIAAHRHPQLFAGLVLFEPIVFPPPPSGDDAHQRGGANPLADGAARRRPSFPSRDDARANFARKPPMSTFVDAALDGYLDGGLIEAADGSVTLSCTPALESATYRAAALHGGWELLPDVDVPTLVIGSPISDVNPPAMIAPLVADRLPNATYLLRDDLDHFGPFVAPTIVASLIAGQLTG